MRRAAGLGATALLVFAGVGAAAPASADCQGGPAWPTLDRARGTTFVGVFDGTTTDVEGFDPGSASSRAAESNERAIVPGFVFVRSTSLAEQMESEGTAGPQHHSG